MDNEEIKIDKENFANQYYENIIQKGEYAEVKILISSGSTECIPSIELKHCSLKDVAFLIASIEGVLKNLKTDFPMSAMLAEFADIEKREIE